MNICDLHTGRNHLSRATKELRDQWQETKEVWNDANARNFAKRHLEPLGPQVTLMLNAINRLRDVLEKAERECSDDQQ
jgi:hypothetical protein